MTGREVLRDKYGTIIGMVQVEGSHQTLRDRYGTILGSYDSHDDLTRDRYGNFIGRGNLLVTLLK